MSFIGILPGLKLLSRYIFKGATRKLVHATHVATGKPPLHLAYIYLLKPSVRRMKLE